MELIEHPFLEEVPENNYHVISKRIITLIKYDLFNFQLSLEVKALLKEMGKIDPVNRSPEINIMGRFLRKSTDEEMELLYEEDLAAMQRISEKEILYMLERHLEHGQCYSYIGDILLFLNPNEKQDIFGDQVRTL